MASWREVYNNLYTNTYAQWAPETTKKYLGDLEIGEAKLEYALKIAYFRSWVHRDWRALRAFTFLLVSKGAEEHCFPGVDADAMARGADWCVGMPPLPQFVWNWGVECDGSLWATNVRAQGKPPPPPPPSPPATADQSGAEAAAPAAAGTFQTLPATEDAEEGDAAAEGATAARSASTTISAAGLPMEVDSTPLAATVAVTVAAGAAGAAETLVYPDAFMQAFATFLARQSGVNSGIAFCGSQAQGSGSGGGHTGPTPDPPAPALWGDWASALAAQGSAGHRPDPRARRARACV